MSDTEKMEAMRKHLIRCADQLDYWKTNIPLHDDGNTEWLAKRARELARGGRPMTDTKDAAQVLRDAGWLVVEPGAFKENGWSLWGGRPSTTTYIVFDYKQETETPDTIDWSHVDPKYRYMARDSNDVVWLYDNRPHPGFDGTWACVELAFTESAEPFASYRRGTVPWDKSLVCREDEE